jgi:hypothetical protein
MLNTISTISDAHTISFPRKTDHFLRNRSSAHFANPASTTPDEYDYNSVRESSNFALSGADEEIFSFPFSKTLSIILEEEISKLEVSTTRQMKPLSK